MTPVMQDRFRGDGRGGNCLAACIASLLDLPLSAVPQRTTTDTASEANFTDWERLALWLHARGLMLLEVDGKAWSTNGLLDSEYEAPLCIGGGPSPRGGKHAVVLRGDELVHDPHPDGGGLLGIESRSYLVPLNPAAPAGNRREAT